MDTRKNIETVSNYLNTFNIVSEYFEQYKEGSIQVIEQNAEVLFVNVLKSVLSYCQINKVRITEFDDVKIVYFLGQELSKMQNDCEFMITAIDILDFLVFDKHGHYASKDMVAKIKNHIKNDTWMEEYGQHGIYSIFKTLIKSC